MAERQLAVAAGNFTLDWFCTVTSARVRVQVKNQLTNRRARYIYWSAGKGDRFDQLPISTPHASINGHIAYLSSAGNRT